MWCYYHSTDGTVDGLDCATYDKTSESASVTYVDSFEILSMDNTGYFGQFGGEGDYAIATWNTW